MPLLCGQSQTDRGIGAGPVHPASPPRRPEGPTLTRPDGDRPPKLQARLKDVAARLDAGQFSGADARTLADAVVTWCTALVAVLLAAC